MTASKERVLLRAREPVARCLMRGLLVPKVYFEARWPSDASRADVVLIDRAGVGDVHVVAVKATLRSAFAAVGRVLAVPAQYRWIAVPRTRSLLNAAQQNIDALLPESGAGRVGLIEIVETNNDLGANIMIQSERFPGSNYELVDDFVARERADIEHRLRAVGRRARRA